MKTPIAEKKMNTRSQKKDNTNIDNELREIFSPENELVLPESESDESDSSDNEQLYDIENNKVLAKTFITIDMTQISKDLIKDSIQPIVNTLHELYELSIVSTIGYKKII